LKNLKNIWGQKVLVDLKQDPLCVLNVWESISSAFLLDENLESNVQKYVTRSTCLLQYPDDPQANFSVHLNLLALMANLTTNLGMGKMHFSSNDDQIITYLDLKTFAKNDSGNPSILPCSVQFKDQESQLSDDHFYIILMETWFILTKPDPLILGRGTVQLKLKYLNLEVAKN
jgi:hypothetical protein